MGAPDDGGVSQHRLGGLGVAAPQDRDQRATASGQRTKSEELGFGGAEFVPWQMGAVM